MASTQSLFLVRHAIAMERSDRWPDDAQRPLSHAGAARMRRAVAGLAKLDATIGLVVTSPLVRAVQTAEILARGLVPHPEVVHLPALAPGVAPARVIDALGAHDKAVGLALVGHAPGIGELAAWILGNRVPLPFKKGAICRIDVPAWPPRHGTLVWFATPRMLRALGEAK